MTVVENYLGRNVSGKMVDTSISPNKIMTTPQPTFQSPEIRRRKQDVNNLKVYKSYKYKEQSIFDANPTYGGVRYKKQRQNKNKPYKNKKTVKMYKVSNFEKMSGLYLDEDMKKKEVSLKRKQNKNCKMKRYFTKNPRNFRDLVF